MIVVGVTGSKGKTTTANMIWAALQASGHKAGSIGTANLRIGDHETLNTSHMTMPGRWHLQKFIRQMADGGCRFAVIETPSEGQAQYRHAGINYDVLVFTNLTHEILEHHRNSFEILKVHNARVFRKLHKQRRKHFDGREIPKTIIVNADSEFSDFYAKYPADKHASFSVAELSDYQARGLKSSAQGTDFTIQEAPYRIPILGDFNVINAAGAVAVATELHVSPEDIHRGLAELKTVAGRMEVIDEGQKFMVIVDYAHEQTGMELLLQSLYKMVKKDAQVIVHLGAEGGGRDKKKRPEMGTIAAKNADIVIVGNVDPYDDDPTKIIEDIAVGAEKAGKKRDKDLYCIEDRRAGIRKALKLAKAGDIVAITGKGAEQSMIVGGKKSAWDDREVVREELRALS